LSWFDSLQPSGHSKWGLKKKRYPGSGESFFSFALKANVLEDVRGITHVINVDYPNNSEDYVHRIGRTGRAGQKGTAITFFTTDNAKQARDLIAVLSDAKMPVDPRLSDMARGSGYGGRGRWSGGRGGGGGGRGGGNRGFTSSNTAPLGQRRY